MSILAVGSIVLDSIRSPHGESRGAIGGSAVYFAGTASYYVPVRIVAVVGEDFPEEGYRFLRERGVDTEGLEVLPGKTFVYEAEYGADPNDRKSLRTCLNVFEDFHPVLPERYRKERMVFLGNIHPSLQIEVLDQIEKPAHVAADTMNYWIRGARADLDRLLPRIDTLFVNDSEVKELTGETNLARAARRAAELGPKTVVVKKGEHGALLSREGTVFAVPAYPVEVVKDPTGGGDAFAGGVLGFLARSGALDEASFRESLLHGTAAASFVVEEFGPRGLYGLPRERLEERVAFLRAMMTIS
ncbi:MAG: sugar kinase [Candidatus Eisenbacteria bacterium]|nr:sugar kinase [Candidatus Eisenbacteria bacterium]